MLVAYTYIRLMQPRRPDSAKSHLTKKTLDSENKDLTASKFSETFTNGVANSSNSISRNEFGDEAFEAYVSEKNKDPRFAKFQKLPLKKNTLKEIPQKQESNPTKPFTKKSNLKVQQPISKQSKGFAQKNKNKLNTLKIVQLQKIKHPQPPLNTKPQIDFSKFKVNPQIKQPLKQPPKQPPKQPLRQPAPPKQSQQQREQSARKENLNEAVQYLQRLQSSNNVPWQLLQEATEQDYLKVHRAINHLDKQLEQGGEQSQLRQRNLFLTQILKVSEQELMAMHSKPEENEEEEERVYNKITERNRAEARGELFRECDYLSAADKLRLNELLTEESVDNPYERDQLEQLRVRRIDEGIRLYGRKIQSFSFEGSLPRDPRLREPAEEKILKEKVLSLNEQLRQVEKIVVNRSKINKVVEECREETRLSQFGEKVLRESEEQYVEQGERIAEVERMIRNSRGQREEVEGVMREMEMQFGRLREETERVRGMEEKQRVREDIEEMKSKVRRIGELQKVMEQQEMGMKMRESERERQERERERLLGEEVGFNSEQSIEEIDRRIRMRCGDINSEQSIEEIDRRIRRRVQYSD